MSITIAFAYDPPVEYSELAADGISAEYEDEQTIDWLRTCKIHKPIPTGSPFLVATGLLSNGTASRYPPPKWGKEPRL